MSQNALIQLLSRCVLCACLFFVLGVSRALFFPDSGTAWMMIVAMVFVFLWGVSGRHSVLLLGGVGILFFVIGGGTGDRAIVTSDISELRGQTVSGIGVVMDDPSLGGFSQRLIVKIEDWRGEKSFVPKEGEGEISFARAGERVSIETNRWRSVSFGDTIRFSCTFKRPENFSADFDFRMYLAAKGVRASCENAEVEQVTDAKNFWGYMGRIRRTLETSVAKSIEEPYVALGNGLLFGGSDRMSDSLAQDFSKTSMTHIVAVSGYNVSMIAGYIFLLAIGLGLWRRSATVVAILGILLFVLFVGSPSSAIRAGVMGCILLFVLVLGRADVSFRALLYAGVGMIAWNPLIVRYDTGFQLSFLATLGIIAFSPWYEKRRPKGIVRQTLADILFMTTSAQLFVLPVILLTFHSFSLVSIATNLLVLWTLPFAMLFTFLTALFGLVSDFLGFVFGMPAQLILWYDIWVVRFFATLSWGVVTVSEGSAWFVGFWYAMVGGAAGWVRWRESGMLRNFCRKK